MDAAGARGEGLEPSITGPEPVVLPITPPPNGWSVQISRAAPGAIRRPDQGRVALNRRVRHGMMRHPGSPRWRTLGSEVLACIGGRQRRSSWPACCPAPSWAAWSASAASAAATAGISVRVTPDRGLVDGQTVTLTGRGLARSSGGKPADLVRRRMHRRRPGPDEPLHRHPALRHHGRPGDPGPHQRHLHRPLPRRDRDHRRRLLRDAGPRLVRHRGGERPGPGHRREDHLQGTLTHGDRSHHHLDHLNGAVTAQASCSHSRWL